jgi:hypothetical protein
MDVPHLVSTRGVMTALPKTAFAMVQTGIR